MLGTGEICLLAALGALAGCTPAGGGEAKQPSGATDSQGSAKFDFKEYLRREIEPLPIRKVAGDVLSADVEAAGPPVVTREKGSVKLVIPIGTKGNIDCFVYNERADGASTVWQVVDAVRKSMEVRLFEATDVFVAREHPVLMSHAIYVLKKDGVAMAGELKMAIYSHPLVSTMCMHDEAGYSAAFKRITKGLFESLSRSDRELRMKPVKWDIGVFKLNGHPIGYEDRTTYESKNDNIVSEQISAKLIPRSAIESVAEDSYEIETVNRSGELLEFTQVDGNSQGIELQINLKRLGPAQYAYVGKQSGKPISGKFRTKDKLGLATTVTVAGNIKNRLLTGKVTSFKTEEYTPSIDPTAPMETLYEIDSRDARRVRSSFGPAKIVGTVDTEGHLEKIEMNAGAATLTMERLASGGKP